MDLITILLIVLIVLAFGGGNFVGAGAYRGPGNIVGLLLILILVFILVQGRL